MPLGGGKLFNAAKLRNRTQIESFPIAAARYPGSITELVAGVHRF